MSLKLYKGGSQITFSEYVKCCITTCGSTREIDRMLPFYTFPSDIQLCKEWLKEIELDDIATISLEKLHTTHIICSKHFKPYKGGMKLCVDKNASHGFTNDVTKNKLQHSSTQTYDDDWIRTLKEENGVEILCGNNIQCRVCGNTSVQAISIYNKRNKKLKMEYLINHFLPIKVKPTDKKPLNICVQCVFKIKQFTDLFNSCCTNDTVFTSINSQQKIKNTNSSNLNKSNQNEMISLTDPKNEKNNNKNVLCENTGKQNTKCLSKKLNSDISNPIDFIKKKIKNTNSSNLNKNNQNKMTSLTNPKNEENNNKSVLCKNSGKQSTKYLSKKLNTDTSNPSDFIKKERRKYQIKILISGKTNNIQNNTFLTENNNEKQCSILNVNNKVIYVKIVAECIICHGREWIYEIKVDENQLKYSQKTIDHILETICLAMKKQCETNNSKVVPLTIAPLNLGRVVVSSNQQLIRTKSVIVNGKKQVNDEISKKAEILENKELIKENWICEICGMKLESWVSYTKHIKFHHPSPCGENLTSRDKLFVHEKKHCNLSKDGYVCHLCGHHFKTHKSLNVHFKQHRNYDKFCCTQCNLHFSNGFGLQKHFRQQHKEVLRKLIPEQLIQNKRIKCLKCEICLSSKLALQVHMKTHLPLEERNKTCPHCKKIFINVRRFKMHLETHGPCPIKCPECSHSFPSQ